VLRHNLTVTLSRHRFKTLESDGNRFLVQLAQVRLSKPALPPRAHDGRPSSKRWVADRAALKQSRAQDLRYVDDPDHLDFLAIYFANGKSFIINVLSTTSSRGVQADADEWYVFYLSFSYFKAREEVTAATEGHRDCDRVFPPVLSQELVL